jgi:hypothetical protein
MKILKQVLVNETKVEKLSKQNQKSLESLQQELLEKDQVSLTSIW